MASRKAALAIHGALRSRYDSPPCPRGQSGIPEEEASSASSTPEVGSHTGTEYAFEEEFARFQDAPMASATSTYASLEIARARRASLPGRSDRAAYTFIATATSVLMVNAVPSSPISSPIPTIWIRKPPKPPSRAHARSSVHVGGCPVDLDAFTELARKHNLTLIEDSGTPTRPHGAVEMVPSAMGTFSFQSSKTSMPARGIIVTDNKQLQERCWSIVNVGRVPMAPAEHHVLGSNYRLTEFQGAAAAQLTRLPEQAERRTENARFLNAELEKIPGSADAPG